MSRLLSCETCPFRLDPEDETIWDRVREAQDRLTPEYSDVTRGHLVEVDRQIQTGIEAYVERCSGYSFWGMAGGLLLDKIAGTGKLVTTDAGTRFISAYERHCRNPFLETEEYQQLADQLTRQAADGYEVAAMGGFETAVS